MHIPSIPITGRDPGLAVNTRDTISLQTGEVVQATVMIVTETAVAVRMKNVILEARTTLPLKKGDVLSLIVEAAGQETRLRVLGGYGDEDRSVRNNILSALSALKGLKPAAEDIKVLSAFVASAPRTLKDLLPGLKVLENLTALIEELSGKDLKNAVRDSGLFLEAKLRLIAARSEQEGPSLIGRGQAPVNNDLKAALLSLKESLGKREAADQLLRAGIGTERLVSAVDNLLKNVELLQLQSRLSDTLQVFVPFVWKDLRDGEIIFRKSDRDQAGEQAFSCTVNLDLERAGWMSARLLLQEGRIYADITAENGRFSKILLDNAELLRKRFDAAGIRLEGLIIRQDARDESRPVGAGGLNIRI